MDRLEPQAELGGLGLLDGEVRVVDYDPSWPAAFSLLAAPLRAVLPAARVEHVGSTSVPGCAAKPLVDLSVGLAPGSSFDLDAADACGLSFRSVNPEAVLFARYDGSGLRLCNVHVREAVSAGERWDLLFRDFLRAHPGEAAAYSEAKRRAAGAADRAAYSAAKAPFIESRRRRIESFAEETGWQLGAPARPSAAGAAGA